MSSEESKDIKKKSKCSATKNPVSDDAAAAAARLTFGLENAPVAVEPVPEEQLFGRPAVDSPDDLLRAKRSDRGASLEYYGSGDGSVRLEGAAPGEAPLPPAQPVIQKRENFNPGIPEGRDSARRPNTCESESLFPEDETPPEPGVLGDGISGSGPEHSSTLLVPEAFLVEEGLTPPEAPVLALHAEPLLPWWKQTHFRILLLVMLVILVGAAISLAVSLSLNNSPINDSVTNDPTSDNSASDNSASTVPTMIPTTSPSLSHIPTLTPTECISQVYSTYQEFDLNFLGLSYPSVAMAGNEVLVTTGTGYVVFFHLQEASWTMKELFSVKNQVDSPLFPSASLSPNSAMVAYPLATTDAGTSAGVLFFYSKNPTDGTWIQLQGPIVPDNGGQQGAFFGLTIAIDGDLAVAAAPQTSVHVYHREGNLWEQVYKVTHPDLCERFLPFVRRVDVVGSSVLISASSHSCIYNYDAETNSLVSLQTLSNEDMLNINYFTFEAQLSEEQFVVSLYEQIIPNLEDDTLRAVYIYDRPQGSENFGAPQILNSSDNDPFFGAWLSIDGDIMAVGGNESLSIYNKIDGYWMDALKLEAPNLLDNFQLSIPNERFAISGRQIIATSKNSVYAYNLEACTESMPTNMPTVSLQPTTTPSLLPSVQSSTVPSQEPTVSFSPSTNPSMQPSQTPSRSVFPSESPSSRPSEVPSSSISPSISLSPTSSVEPSLFPTTNPSKRPSQVPSNSLSPSTTTLPSEDPTNSLVPSTSLYPSNEPSRSQLPSSSLSPTTSCISILTKFRQQFDLGGYDLFYPNVSVHGNNAVVITGKGYVVFFSLLKGNSWSMTDVFSVGEQIDFSAVNSVSLHGDVAIVGYPRATTEAGVEAGIVFFYEQNVASGVWYDVQGPVHPDNGGEANSWFGSSVDVDSDLAVVGAKTDYDYTGSLYIYRRYGGIWQQVHKEIPFDASIGLFGTYVNVKGTTIALSSLYLVYIYDFDLATNTVSFRKEFLSDTCDDCQLEISQMSEKHIVYSTSFKRITHTVFIYDYDHKGGNKTFSDPQSFNASDYGGNFGSFLAVGTDVLVIGGNETLFVFTPNESKWEEILRWESPNVADELYPHFLRNRLAMSRNQLMIASADSVYAYNLDYCIQ